MSDTEAGFRVRRTTRIEAPPDIVFGFVSDPALFARWFGEGSSIEAREGGAVKVVFPGGAEAVGEVLAVDPPRHIRFTWGYPREDAPVAPGASTVDVRIDPTDEGSLVTLEHVLPSRGAAEAHEGGWAYHLSRLAAKAAREGLRDGVRDALAAWFEAWSADGDEIGRRLGAALADDASYRDDAVVAPTPAEVAAHIGRCHAQMPGSRLERTGPVLQTGDRIACPADLMGSKGRLGGAWITARIASDGRLREVVGLFTEPIPGVSDGPLF